MKKQYEDFLKDKKVKEWYDNIARGHESTASVYYRSLSRFCVFNKLKPSDLIKMKPDERDSLLLSYVDKRVKQGMSGSFVQSELKSIRAWLSWHSISITKKIKIPGANRRPSLKNETVPSQDELKKILNSADTRERVAISLVAFSGVRLEAIGDYDGSDGLTIGDFPELEIKDGTVSFSKIPTLVKIREELSKTDNQYFTFFGPEGCQYLKAYLESRIQHGEKLNKDSPLIVPVRQTPHFISTINIGDIIRGPMRLANNMNRPYVLRSFFATQTMQAESKGLLRDWRVFMMGHKGDIEHTYTLNKNHLSTELIEKMREAYTSAIPYLETSYDPKTVGDLITDTYRQLAIDVYDLDPEEVSGKSMSEISTIIKSHNTGDMGFLHSFSKILDVDPETLKNMSGFQLTEKLLQTFGPDGAVLKPVRKQVIVEKSRLKELIEQGYEYVSTIDDSVIMWTPLNK
jgi:hypothetical protein